MTDASSLSQQAYDHLQAGENIQAAAVLETMLAAAPADAMVRGKLVTAYLRAVVQTEPRDVAEAERLLLKALRADGANAAVQLGYDKFLRRHGRDLEADRLQEEAQAVNTAAAELDKLLFVAKKAYDSRDYATSVAHLEELIAADPANGAALKLAPLACYRAGLLDHPLLTPVRRQLANPADFALGLTKIAQAIGVEAAADDGSLPERAHWSPSQRYQWGRRVDALIRDQVLGGPTSRADLARRMQSFDLPPELRDGGGIILLLHVGSVNTAVGKVVASGIPYNLVTNGVLHGLALPGSVIDVFTGRANTLLARMAVALRRGANVVVAADGPLGQRFDLITHDGVEYPLAAGPLALAHQMRAPTHLLVAGYEARSLACRYVPGPPPTSSLAELQSFWGQAIRSEIVRLTALGPENQIRQANPAQPPSEGP